MDEQQRIEGVSIALRDVRTRRERGQTHTTQRPISLADADSYIIYTFRSDRPSVGQVGAIHR